MRTMETVECFSVDFAFAFDFEGNIESFTFGNDWYFPCNFYTGFGFIG